MNSTAQPPNASHLAATRRRNLACELTKWLMCLEDLPGTLDDWDQACKRQCKSLTPPRVEYMPEPDSSEWDKLEEELTRFLDHTLDEMPQGDMRGAKNMSQLYTEVNNYLDGFESNI